MLLRDFHNGTMLFGVGYKISFSDNNPLATWKEG